MVHSLADQFLFCSVILKDGVFVPACPELTVCIGYPQNCGSLLSRHLGALVFELLIVSGYFYMFRIPI